MPSATPADVLARRRHLMLDGDADGFADLFAPDAVIEFSFHGPPGAPVRLAGREAIREIEALRQLGDMSLGPGRLADRLQHPHHLLVGSAVQGT